MLKKVAILGILQILAIFWKYLLFCVAMGFSWHLYQMSFQVYIENGLTLHRAKIGQNEGFVYSDKYFNWTDVKLVFYADWNYFWNSVQYEPRGHVSKPCSKWTKICQNSFILQNGFPWIITNFCPFQAHWILSDFPIFWEKTPLDWQGTHCNTFCKCVDCTPTHG